MANSMTDIARADGAAFFTRTRNGIPDSALDACSGLFSADPYQPDPYVPGPVPTGPDSDHVELAKRVLRRSGHIPVVRCDFDDSAALLKADGHDPALYYRVDDTVITRDALLLMAERTVTRHRRKQAVADRADRLSSPAGGDQASCLTPAGSGAGPEQDSGHG